MHHRYAIIFNKETGKKRRLTAPGFSRVLAKIDKEKAEAQFELEIYKRPKSFVRDNYEIFSENDGNPLVFREKHFQLGRDKEIRASFAYASGYGQEDHLYNNRQSKRETLRSAVQQGKKILLSINNNTTERSMKFRKMKAVNDKSAFNDLRGKNLEDWLHDNRLENIEHVSVSVRSAKELRRKILQVYNFHPAKSHEESLEFVQQNVHALHYGGVLPYMDFYLGARQKDIKALFNNLHRLETSVPLGIGTRHIGFPRLIRFKPTKKMCKTPLAGRPSGNFIRTLDGKVESKSILTFAQKDIDKTNAYKILTQEIANSGERGVFVLASPRVTVPKSGRTARGVTWEILLWNISDMDEQIFDPANDRPQDVIEKKPTLAELNL